jgi:hypothetical protein
MGVKFGKEYDEIMDDLSAAIGGIEHGYKLFEMAPEDWEELGEEERMACIRTLADDVFYGLGAEPVMQLEDCTVTYDSKNHVILLAYPEGLVRIVHLV